MFDLWDADKDQEILFPFTGILFNSLDGFLDVDEIQTIICLRLVRKSSSIFMVLLYNKGFSKLVVSSSPTSSPSRYRLNLPERVVEGQQDRICIHDLEVVEVLVAAQREEDGSMSGTV
jgi:hypothetical protein